MKGLEPPRLSASDPKSDAATNYAISANLWRKGKKNFIHAEQSDTFFLTFVPMRFPI